MAASDDERPPLSRRTALKTMGAVGAAGVVGVACTSPPDRCADPPATPAADPRLAGIDHVIVLMFENRSFDHLFGMLRSDPDYPDRARVDGLAGIETNPDRDGNLVRVYQAAGDIVTGGPERSWNVSHRAWNGGLNDGFVLANDPPHSIEAMAYHDRSHAPLHYALADRYTVCDRWFASVMAATWPNRYYLHAASSNGRTTNDPWGPGAPLTIWERMAERCRSAKNYYAGVVAWYSIAFAERAIGGNGALVPERIEHFFRDARQGTLPDFAVIDPDFHVNDMHPPHTMAMGEAFLGAVVRAIEESPQWPRTLLVVTCDENGGFYDHVAPPATADERPDFAQLGFRVPALLIGPSVWQGRVVSTPLEHVSILSTLRARFGIDSLGARMDATADLSSCIDPDRVGVSSPPRLRSLPPAALPGAHLEMARSWTSSQAEMDAAVRSGAVPESHLNARPVEDRLAAWLDPAQELGAVRILK